MQWEGVFDGIAEGLLAVDRRGTVLYANASAAEAFGCPTSEGLRGRRIAEFDADPATSELSALITRVLADELLAETEVHLPATGRWLAARSYPAEGGGVTVFLHDVTDRRLAEDALRVSEAKFAGIVNISADAIISIDAEHLIIHFNRGAEEIFGCTAAEMIGRPLDALIPERFRTGHPQHIRNFDASPVVARRMGERREISALRSNGEEFPAEASISKLNVGGQRIFTVVLRDVTERNRREENYRRLYEEAQRAIAARDDVLSFVSHDLGNPLAAIRISTAVLLKHVDPAGADVRHVAGIREAVEQAQRLIRDLLDVQKAETGKLALHIESVDVRSAVDEVIRSMQQFIEEKSIRVTSQTDGEPSRVEADPDRFAQVLGNLLSNAIKFSPAGGVIGISVSREADEVVVAISDEGPGISEEDLPHIFDRYFQAGRPGKVGHGLGLSIVQALMRAHDGRAWARSRPGAGSTFYIALPAAAADG